MLRILGEAGVLTLKRHLRPRRLLAAIVLLVLAGMPAAGCGRSDPWAGRTYDDALARKLGKLAYLGSIAGARKKPLSKPLTVELGAGGLVYVADRNEPPPNLPLPMLVTGRIQVFREKDGKFLFAFNRTKGLNRLDVPSSIAVNPKSGNLFIADTGNDAHAVYQFTPKGRFVGELRPPKDVGMDWSPVAVAFNRSGDLYVLDVREKLQRVVVFEGTSKVRRTFGRAGAAEGPDDKPGEFWYPTSFAVAPNDWVFVADTQNRRLQAFDQDGEFRKIIYTGGAPMGIRMAPDGLLVMTDAYNHQFAVYTPEGKLVEQYGGEGYKRGQFGAPSGVTLDAKTGWLFIADPENNRVEVWAPRIR